jgi:hypothetical protein
MATIIIKWPLEQDKVQVLMLPVGAKILCVQALRERPCIWVLGEEPPYVDVEKRVLVTFRTGDRLPVHDAGYLGRYVGTYQLESGNVIGHVFEQT